MASYVLGRGSSAKGGWEKTECGRREETGWGGAEKPDLRARLVGHGGEPGLHPEEAGACDGFVAKERHAQICT